MICARMRLFPATVAPIPSIDHRSIQGRRQSQDRHVHAGRCWNCAPLLVDRFVAGELFGRQRLPQSFLEQGTVGEQAPAKVQGRSVEFWRSASCSSLLWVVGASKLTIAARNLGRPWSSNRTMSPWPLPTTAFAFGFRAGEPRRAGSPTFRERSQSVQPLVGRRRSCNRVLREQADRRQAAGLEPQTGFPADGRSGVV